MFTIDAGVPLPERPEGRRYPFPAMKVGDSFLVPMGAGEYDRTHKKIQQALKNFRRVFDRPNFRIATRRETDGIRVWRIEDFAPKAGVSIGIASLTPVTRP